MARSSARGAGRVALHVGVVVAVVWGLAAAGLFPGAGRAAAQVPDAGKQRLQQLEGTAETNALLKEIRDLLKSGVLNVRMAEKKAE